MRGQREGAQRWPPRARSITPPWHPENPAAPHTPPMPGRSFFFPGAGKGGAERHTDGTFNPLRLCPTRHQPSLDATTPPLGLSAPSPPREGGGERHAAPAAAGRGRRPVRAPRRLGRGRPRAAGGAPPPPSPPPLPRLRLGQGQGRRRGLQDGGGPAFHHHCR